MPITYWPIVDTQVTEDKYEAFAAPGQVDGLLGHPDDQDLIYADSSGRQVKIRAGRYGRVRGWGLKTAATDEALLIDENLSGSTRIDLVVARLNRATWTVSITKVNGVPGGGAPVPTMQIGPTSGVWEMPLAEVTVAPGAVNLAAGTVKPRNFYIGPGCVLCKSTTRPPVSAGLRLLETDTGKEYVGVGSAWKATFEDTDSVSLGLSSGWSAIMAKVRRRDGICVLDLAVSRSGGQLTIGTDAPILTLPSGFRPAHELRPQVAVWLSSTNVMIGILRITTSGVVSLTDYGQNIPTGKSVYNMAPITFVSGG